MTETHAHGTAGGSATEAPADDGDLHRAHPGEREYIKIALILAVITLAEVGIVYIESLENLLPPILIAMSLVKFAMVVLWFMHLRFDSRLFRRFFVTGIVLALFIYMIVLTLFGVWTR